MSSALALESFVLLGLAVLGIWEGVRLTTVVLVSSEPVGPGWYLLFLSLLLFASAAAYIVRRVRTGGDTGRLSLSVLRGPAAQATAFLVLYAIAIQIVGYAVSTALFFILTLHSFGVKSWIKSAVIGVALALAFQYGFSDLAGIPLP